MTQSDVTNRPTSGSVRRTALLAGVAMAMLAFAIPAQQAVAADDEGPVLRCPRKVGGLRYVRPKSPDRESQLFCPYNAPKKAKGDPFEFGRLALFAHWSLDVPESRARCVSREPQWVDDRVGGRDELASRLHSSRRRASVTFHLTEGTRVTRKQAEAAARSMLPAAEHLAHPCIPVDLDPPEDSFYCPLSLGSRWVLLDWFDEDGLPTVREQTARDPGARWRAFECSYGSAYTDEGAFERLQIDWAEGPSEAASRTGPFCLEKTSDVTGTLRTESGVRPLNVSITPDLAATGGRAVANHLAALASELTPLCPGVTAPSSGDIAGTATTLDRIEGGLDERRTEIIRLAEQAEAATGDERIGLLAEAYEKQASSVETFARELAAESFPDTVREAVAAVISASQTEAQLWREIAADREAIAEDRIDVATAALEARRAAVTRLRRILGIGP